MLRKSILILIKLYQKLISPLLPARCRYYPTCSEYGKQAVLWHGGFKGGRLLVWRLLRCQPWGGHGVDFVPLPMQKYHFYPLESISYNNKNGRFVHLCKDDYKAMLGHQIRRLTA